LGAHDPYKTTYENPLSRRFRCRTNRLSTHERDCWLGSIPEKGTPSLQWRPPMAHQVLGHRRLRDLDAQLLQFPVNERRAPEGPPTSRYSPSPWRDGGSAAGVGRKNSMHRHSFCPAYEDSRQVKDGRGFSMIRWAGEGGRRLVHIQSGPDRRESAPALAVDHGATPGTTPQVHAGDRQFVILACRESLLVRAAHNHTRQASKGGRPSGAGGPDDDRAVGGPHRG
jgi:hypothetical protein